MQVLKLGLTGILTITSLGGLSLSAQELFPPTQPIGSLTLMLSGPTLVRAGDSPHYRAFIVNNTKTDIRLPSYMLTDDAALLEWKVVDAATHRTSSNPARHTWCDFGKKFQQQDGFFVLRPAQRLELRGIEIPDFFLRPSGKGIYRISLRYELSAVVEAGDILKEQIQPNITSNQLTVVFSEY